MRIQREQAQAGQARDAGAGLEFGGQEAVRLARRGSGSGMDRAKRCARGSHGETSLYAFDDDLCTACAPTHPRAIGRAGVVTQAPKPASGIDIRLAAPASIAALCASVRGRIRAK